MTFEKFEKILSEVRMALWNYITADLPAGWEKIGFSIPIKELRCVPLELALWARKLSLISPSVYVDLVDKSDEPIKLIWYTRNEVCATYSYLTFLASRVLAGQIDEVIQTCEKIKEYAKKWK